jgi:flagellin-like hook-associated protein FlgL
MSGITMTGVSGNATLSRLILDSAATRQRLDTLTNQVSTGLVADNYAGLGTGAPVSLALHPQIASMQTWQNNVDVATGRMSVAQSALAQIQSIGASFYAQLNSVQGLNASAVDTIAASARDALGQVASALNTQDGGVYVFGGQDTANPPVPGNILTSAFYTQINAAVTGLAGNGAAVTAQATYDIANVGGTSPFSAYLSQPYAVLQANLPVVQVGQNQTEPVGIPASANGLIPNLPNANTIPPPVPPVPSTIPGGPPASTGSYMRDVLRALATIGSLSSAQASDPGFASLVQDTRISLSGGVAAMAQDAGVLGNVQSSLTATQSRLADTQVALTGQVSSAEEVDMATTLSRLSQVQTQMQASYQLIASLNSLSLLKYLPVG